MAVCRPTYVRLLLVDLVAKTSALFETLPWLNVANVAIDTDIASAVARGVPLRVLGRTPANISMRAFASLFAAARHP